MKNSHQFTFAQASLNFFADVLLIPENLQFQIQFNSARFSTHQLTLKRSEFNLGTIEISLRSSDFLVVVFLFVPVLKCFKEPLLFVFISSDFYYNMCNSVSLGKNEYLHISIIISFVKVD